jgi:serine/threonine-protein kinase
MTQARLLGGRYQVGELLGYGGMAEVHRGRDLRLGRDVAIKMLRTDLARDDTFQLRFRREAQNAAALNHPAIVAVYDTGEERGSSGETLPYIVMEYVNGRTLKEVLQVEGRLMPRRALEMTAEICSALEFSHRHGIIHRDIKPGNVMLTQTGQIKVMDFGIARALANSGSTMTQTSAVIGTAQYLSPEQARGETVDARSDVYATGCVLYELLCGQPPFVGDSPVSVAYQHVRENARPPSLINRDVSPALDAVVLKALAKNPLNRYQSAAEMRADVLRAAQGRPVYAEPVLNEDHGATRMLRPGPGGRPMPVPPQRRRTNPWLIAGLSGLAVVAVIALVIGLIAAAQPTNKAVPRIIGQPRSQAEALLRSEGFSPKGTPKTNLTCTLNQVMAQSPAANTSVAEHSTVTYDYCAGPGQQQIPPLQGLPKDAAETQLTNLGLNPAEDPVDSDQPKDTVISTDPAAGTTVDGGATVHLKISKGNLKQVPAVSGKGYDLNTAKALLEQAGFTDPSLIQTPTRITNVAADNNKVVDQSPQAGTLADPTTTKIELFIGQYTGPTSSATATATATSTPTP